MVGRALFAIMGLTLLLALPGAEADASAGFKIIVHPSVKGSGISKDLLSQVFLGRVQRWGNGTQITPVDLSAMSPVRAVFSETMLGMPTLAVRRYWEQRLVAGGGRPPMVKGSEEEMIAAVAAEEGAIGYLPQDTPVPETVRVILVQ